MKLKPQQKEETWERYGVRVNEICDKCGQALGYLRYTRINEPGEWCSRVCRDGEMAAQRYTVTRKAR